MKRTQPDVDTIIPSPGPGEDHYLVFKCGNTVPMLMLKSVAKNGRKCPICGVGLSHKIFKCETCEKWMLKHSRVSHCRFCGPCAKIERKLYQRRVNAAAKLPQPQMPKAKKRKRPLAIPPKTDCFFYEISCLPEAAHKSGGYRRVDCRDCPDYIPVPMHATINGCGNEYAVDNHGCPTNWAM